MHSPGARARHRGGRRPQRLSFRDRQPLGRPDRASRRGRHRNVEHPPADAGARRGGARRRQQSDRDRSAGSERQSHRRRRRLERRRNDEDPRGGSRWRANLRRLGDRRRRRADHRSREGHQRHAVASGRPQGFRARRAGRPYCRRSVVGRDRRGGAPALRRSEITLSLLRISFWQSTSAGSGPSTSSPRRPKPLPHACADRVRRPNGRAARMPGDRAVAARTAHGSHCPLARSTLDSLTRLAGRLGVPVPAGLVLQE